MFQHEERIIIHIYSPNYSALNFIRQTLIDIKIQANIHTIIKGDFSTPLSQIDRSTEQIIQQRNKRIEPSIWTKRLNKCMQSFPPNKNGIYSFLRSTCCYFQSRSHTNSCLRKCKRSDFLACILSDQSAIKLQVNSKGNHRNYANSWELNNTLNNHCVMEGTKLERRRLRELNDVSAIYQNLWDTVETVFRGKFMPRSAPSEKQNEPK